MATLPRPRPGRKRRHDLDRAVSSPAYPRRHDDRLLDRALAARARAGAGANRARVRAASSRLRPGRSARAGQALAGTARGGRGAGRDQAEDGPAAAAEAEVPDHLGVDAGLDRGLRADLGLAVRGRLRAAAARARDGSRDPASARGRRGLGADVHPLPRRRDLREVARRRRRGRGAGRARRPDPGHPRDVDPARRSGSPPARSSGRRSPTSASSSTCSTCCRCCRSTAAARWRHSRPGSGSSASPGWWRSRSPSRTRS